MFITFEGVEGSGKTTQLGQLAAVLRADGHEVIQTREPGGLGVPAAEAIRALLLDPRHALHARAELLLFQASRAQHVEQLIRPALARGAVVLCDRYYHASLAYQGAGRCIDRALVMQLIDFAVAGVHPDLVLLVDLEPTLGLARAHHRAQGQVDRIEGESLDFHRQVRHCYLDLAQADPARFEVLDGRSSIEDLHGEVVRIVRKQLVKDQRRPSSRD